MSYCICHNMLCHCTTDTSLLQSFTKAGKLLTKIAGRVIKAKKRGTCKLEPRCWKENIDFTKIDWQLHDIQKKESMRCVVKYPCPKRVKRTLGPKMRFSICFRTIVTHAGRKSHYEDFFCSNWVIVFKLSYSKASKWHTVSWNLAVYHMAWQQATNFVIKSAWKLNFCWYGVMSSAIGSLLNAESLSFTVMPDNIWRGFPGTLAAGREK